MARHMDDLKRFIRASLRTASILQFDTKNEGSMVVKRQAALGPLLRTGVCIFAAVVLKSEKSASNLAEGEDGKRSDQTSTADS